MSGACRSSTQRSAHCSARVRAQAACAAGSLTAASPPHPTPASPSRRRRRRRRHPRLLPRLPADARSASSVPLCGKVALITGITGQDGSYLAELLLAKGYVVHGIVRRSSSFNTSRIEHLYQDKHVRAARFSLEYGDLSDATSLLHIISKVRPDEVYNLGAQSHVKVSFEMPEYTSDVDGVGTLRLLDAIRSVGLEKTCRFYQASTSELYGLVRETPQSETTPFYPRSPYAVAKQFAFWMCVNYREAYGMYVTNGILFNHESPRRGPTFVTRKVTRAVARIARGLQTTVYLGNIDAKRDWGHARDYVEGMWRMLQQDTPDDFVLATGETHTCVPPRARARALGAALPPPRPPLLPHSTSASHARSVREFCERAFAVIGLTLRWEGSGADERGYDAADDKRAPLVAIDAAYYRPTEVELLLGNPAKAKRILGWQSSTAFSALVTEMVEADLALVDRGELNA